MTAPTAAKFTRKQRRAILIVTAVAGVTGALLLVLFALRSGVDYFYTRRRRRARSASRRRHPPRRSRRQRQRRPRPGHNGTPSRSPMRSAPFPSSSTASFPSCSAKARASSPLARSTPPAPSTPPTSSPSMTRPTCRTSRQGAQGAGSFGSPEMYCEGGSGGEVSRHACRPRGRSHELSAPWLPEAVGTFAFVLTGCGTLMSAFANPIGPLYPARSLSGSPWRRWPSRSVTFPAATTSGRDRWPRRRRRFPATAAPSYILTQCLGACLAVGLLLLAHPVAPGAQGTVSVGIAAVAAHYGGPAEASAIAAFAIEGVAAAVLVLVIVGSTARTAPAGFAPLAIGAVYAALHLLAYPLTGAALNPARALGPAVFAGGEALADPVAVLGRAARRRVGRRPPRPLAAIRRIHPSSTRFPNARSAASMA